MNFCAGHKQRNSQKGKIVRFTRKALAFALPSFALLAAASQARALDFGTFEARGLAMGGAVVAGATGQHAQYYNPALLSMYEGNESETKNGRFYFPAITFQASEAAIGAISIIDSNVNESILAFNGAQTDDTVSELLDSLTSMQSDLEKTNQGEITIDSFIGLSVSEPSDRSGGAFYVGTRFVGGGQSNFSQADLDLLDDYVEAVDFIASAGVSGEAHAELFVGGQLTNPEDNISSSAQIDSLVISEWGVALSREFWLGKFPIALGITPKIMRVDVFSETLTYGDTDFDYQDDKVSYFRMNADIGVAVPLGKHFRLGLAAKDIKPESYETVNGDIIDVQPRARFGAAFLSRRFDLAFDIDLQKNASLGSDLGRQEVSAGLEYRVLRWMDLRVGYRQDLEGVREPTLSSGLKFKAGPLITEFAYSFSDELQGGSLQLGWAF
ncbi:MAG: hypothetical protein ACI93R_001451 [Flavobacteriales bacterium]|jgi:hypothetical protein